MAIGKKLHCNKKEMDVKDSKEITHQKGDNVNKTQAP